MALSALAHDIDVQDAPHNGVMSDAYLDPHVYVTVGQMLDFCNLRPMSHPFTARGVVIDTTADIKQQLHDYFPSHIDLNPVFERIIEVCTNRARETSQPLQVVSFDHLRTVKPIESDAGDMETFIEILADRRVKISQFTTIKTSLKQGGGGSGGGDPAQMLAEIQQANIQGFALQVKTLAISDAKASELLANMGVAQAFGGDGPAISEALDTIAAGGPEADALKAVIEQVAEIKNLRSELANAPDQKTAAAITKDLTGKTEALMVKMEARNLTPAVKANFAKTVESVRTTLNARQLDNAVRILGEALPAGMARVANDIGFNSLSVQVSRHVAALDTIARTNAMPVRDVIALTLTGNATPAMVKAVETVTTLMAKPEFLPTIEQGLPPAVSVPVREAITTPVLHEPTPAAVTAQALQDLAQKMDVPTVTQAAVILEQAGQPVAVEAVAPALQIPQLQAVVDNLQAIAMTSAVPDHMKPELAALTARVEQLVVEARTQEPQAHNVLQPTAPLAVMAEAVQVEAPKHIAPTQLSPDIILGQPNHWGESPNAPSERREMRQPQPQETRNDNDNHIGGGIPQDNGHDLYKGDGMNGLNTEARRESSEYRRDSNDRGGGMDNRGDDRRSTMDAFKVADTMGDRKTTSLFGDRESDPIGGDKKKQGSKCETACDGTCCDKFKAAATVQEMAETVRTDVLSEYNVRPAKLPPLVMS